MVDVSRWSNSICPDCGERLRQPAPDCLGCCIYKIMKEYLVKQDTGDV